MAFFQNVFNQDFNGSFSDVSFRIGGNVNTSEVMDSGNYEPYDLSSDAVFTINFSLDKGLNYNPVAVNVSTGALSTSAVKAHEVVAALNANALFAAYYTAYTYTTAAGQSYVSIKTLKPRLQMKSYISNSSAEKKLKFNKRAPVAELPSYFSRHVIGQQSTFSDSLGLLIELDVDDPIDQAIITAAGFDYTSPKEDWQLLRGASNNYRFKKRTLDSLNREISIIEYFVGARVGDQAIQTNYVYTGSNINPDQITVIPIVLENEDLIVPTDGASSFPGYATGFDLDPSLQIFADEAGTVPAVADDDVYRWDDVNGSTKAKFFTSWSYAKPKLKVDGNGKRYLEMPAGLGNLLSGAGSEYLIGQSGIGINQNLSACSVYCVLEPLSRAAFQGFVSFGAQYEGVLSTQQDGAATIYAQSFAGGNFVSSNNGGLPAYTMDYGINTLGFSCGPTSVRFATPKGNSLVNSSAGAGLRTGCRIFVNGTGNNNAIPAGKIYRVLVYGATHTPEQQDQVMAYLRTTYARPSTRNMDEDCVFFFGDSRSFGQETRISLDLPNTSGLSGIQFRNLSVSGSSATSLTARLSELTSQFSTTAKNIVVIWEGVNPAYALSDLDILFTMMDTIRAFPMTQVIACSEIPNYSATDTNRQIWLNDPNGFYSNWTDHADYMADFATEATIGVRQVSAPSEYSDNVHLNDYTLLGAILEPVIVTALT